MNYENVFELFREQFETDKDIEVVHFKRGYQIFVWDHAQEAYSPHGELINNPEKLYVELLDETKRYYEFKYRNAETGIVDEEQRKIINKILKEIEEKSVRFR